MKQLGQMQGMHFRSLAIVVALFLSGCAIVGQDTVIPPQVETIESVPTRPPEPVRPQAPETPEPTVFSSRVAIVLSGMSPAYENVATALGELLEDYSIHDLSDKSLTPREIFGGIELNDTEIVVAIGLRAATVAKAYSKVPVVFCQVFNVADNNLTSAQVKGVAALPPLALQVEAWKDLNPELRHVGAILGTGHDALIQEAGEAAGLAGLTLHHRIARSDRETLYMFNRLTPVIDGFWLFPDNRVLSPAVLRQMLSYAARHRVQVAAFNPALLDLGATLSATSVDSDIAATVVSVARRVVDGDSNSIPDMTPLNEIDVQTNRVIIKKSELAAAIDEGAR